MFRVLPSLRARALGIIALAGIASSVGASVAYADAKSPEGIWYTKGEESIIRVHPCVDVETSFCGTLVWLKEPKETDGTPKVDKLNKDPAKKGQPMIGVDILLGMKPDDDHYKGKAYNPEDGKFYDITFKVKTDKVDDDSADLRGCILGFLCQTEAFTRATEVPGGDPTLAALDASSAKKPHKAAKKEAKKDPAHK